MVEPTEPTEPTKPMELWRPMQPMVEHDTKDSSSTTQDKPCDEADIWWYVHDPQKDEVDVESTLYVPLDVFSYTQRTTKTPKHRIEPIFCDRPVACKCTYQQHVRWIRHVSWVVNLSTNAKRFVQSQPRPRTEVGTDET